MFIQDQWLFKGWGRVSSCYCWNQIQGLFGGKPFTADVRKIKGYIDKSPQDVTQYYLAFVHEIEYENIEDDYWLTTSQQKWANGRLSELSGHYINGKMQ